MNNLVLHGLQHAGKENFLVPVLWNNSSLLPGHKLEWPISTMVLPVPWHERVKLMTLGKKLRIEQEFGVIK